LIAYFAADWVGMDWTAMMRVGVAAVRKVGEGGSFLVFCLFSCGLGVEERKRRSEDGGNH
jgi:hypothetical protein